MIATHNIKIGGRWYKAGEEINSSADFMNTPEIPEYGEKKFTKTENLSNARKRTSGACYRVWD